MKWISVVSAIASFGLLAGACSKHSGPSNPNGQTLDTLQIKFAIYNHASGLSDTNTYSLTNILSTTDTPNTRLFVDTQAPALSGQDTIFYLQSVITDSAINTQTTLRLAFKHTPGIISLVPGTYTYNEPVLVSEMDSLSAKAIGWLIFAPSGTDWQILQSDTVIITDVSNGYASGTFNATYAISIVDPTSVIHLSAGSFKGVKFYQ
jgi:hypothetical protein